MPLSALRDALDEGRITSTNLVAAHIKLVKQVNPTINAVVETCFEDAMHQAQAADKEQRGIHLDLLFSLFRKKRMWQCLRALLENVRTTN